MLFIKTARRNPKRNSKKLEDLTFLGMSLKIPKNDDKNSHGYCETDLSSKLFGSLLKKYEVCCKKFEGLSSNVPMSILKYSRKLPQKP